MSPLKYNPLYLYNKLCLYSTFTAYPYTHIAYPCTYIHLTPYVYLVPMSYDAYPYNQCIPLYLCCIPYTQCISLAPIPYTLCIPYTQCISLYLRINLHLLTPYTLWLFLTYNACMHLCLCVPMSLLFVFVHRYHRRLLFRVDA